MRLSITGAAGIGKTTLARALAEHFRVPVLTEDFSGIVRTFNTPPPPGESGVSQWRAACRAACCDWLRQRETRYRANLGFVEDRCAIDILLRWLLENLSDTDNGETGRMIEATRALVAMTDFVVIPPLLPMAPGRNDDGLVRAGSLSRVYRAQSLVLGIATQLVAPVRLICLPDHLQSVGARVDFVLTRIEGSGPGAEPRT